MPVVRIAVLGTVAIALLALVAGLGGLAWITARALPQRRKTLRKILISLKCYPGDGLPILRYWGTVFRS